MRILVVEDDVAMARVLERGLREEGHDPVVVGDGVTAMIELSRATFTVAILDVMLPGMSGFELCRHVRSSGHSLPILLLTARERVEDRVLGLDSGADDYLTKPFSFAELAARLKALVRRDPTPARGLITVGPLTLDSHELRATLGGRELSLSPREFALLRLLALHVGETVTRALILERVWRGGDNLGDNVIDQYVSYVRRKLHDEGPRIATVRGVGFRLDAEPSAG